MFLSAQDPDGRVKNGKPLSPLEVLLVLLNTCCLGKPFPSSAHSGRIRNNMILWSSLYSVRSFFFLGLTSTPKLTSHCRFWTPSFLLWLKVSDICEQSVSKELGERLWLTACLQTGCLKRCKGDSGKGLVKFKTCDSISKDLLEAEKFLGSLPQQVLQIPYTWETPGIRWIL